MQRKIVVLGTGGTIAGTSSVAGANVGYTAGQIGVQQLLAAIPGLERAAGGVLVAEQVAQLDSKDMDFEVWTRLVQRCTAHLADPLVAGIVITHGTDTLEETAWLLHQLLDASRPVVLTCAMRPATALVPDGPQNLLDAVTLAAHPAARGVLLVAAGRVHGAREVSKVHPLRLDAFESGDTGPLGWVEADRVRWAHGQAPLAAVPTHAALVPALDSAPWPRVEIVLSHAGTDGVLVDWAVQGGARGIVVAATGDGTLHHALEAALARAVAAGVQVRVASRCPLGRMRDLPDAPWRGADGLSPVKARVSLLLELLQASMQASI